MPSSLPAAKKNTQTYRVISLANINDGHGWEINEAHYTSLEVTPETLTMRGVFRALKDIEYLAKHLQPSRYEFDEDELDRTITIRRRRDGWWLVQLELKETTE